MPVMIPLLAKTTCNHELVLRFFPSVELLAIAEDVEEIVRVNVFSILMVILNELWGREKAPMRHPPISAITPKVHAHLQLKPIMRLVARQHAPETEPMRLHKTLNPHQSIIVGV